MTTLTVLPKCVGGTQPTSSNGSMYACQEGLGLPFIVYQKPPELVLILQNQYVTQLDNPQVAFSVKQTKPSTVDDAVRSTLEMESFLKPSGAASVSPLSVENEGTETVAATNQDDTMKRILERMDQIEAELKSARLLGPSQQRGAGSPSRGRWRGRSARSNPGNCWNCGGEGHLSHPEEASSAAGKQRLPSSALS